MCCLSEYKICPQESPVGPAWNLPAFSDHFWLVKTGAQSEMANSVLLAFTAESPSLSLSNVGL